MLVNEIFSSLQGEGVNIGVPMTFVRLAKCNLAQYGGCKWCDTPYSFEEGHQYTEEQIIEWINKWPNQWVCITGGEPLLQNLDELCKGLRETHKLTIETNGTVTPSSIVYNSAHQMTVSPKMSNSGMDRFLRPDVIASLLTHPNPQLKFVCESSKDIMEALALCNLFKEERKLEMEKIPIIFQPQGLASIVPKTFSVSDQERQWMATENYLKQLKELWGFVLGVLHIYPGWDLRVLPQLHRLVFGPGVRKV